MGALIPGFIIHLTPPVMHILVGGRFSKVANAIVKPIAVYVVNLVLGPFAIVNRPHYPVREELLVVHSTDLIPVSAYRRERLFPREPCIPRLSCPFTREHLRRPRLPVQLPGLRLVPQKLAQLFRGW